MQQGAVLARLLLEEVGELLAEHVRPLGLAPEPRYLLLLLRPITLVIQTRFERRALRKGLLDVMLRRDHLAEDVRGELPAVGLVDL